MPARAALTPACQVPSVLVTLPCGSSSAVSSPKYQTLPALSCAYQSVVRSPRWPCTYRRSLTALHGAPWIVFVVVVALTTSREGLPSFTPLYVQVVPGFSGNQGLSTRETKRLLPDECPQPAS